MWSLYFISVLIILGGCAVFIWVTGAGADDRGKFKIATLSMIGLAAAALGIGMLIFLIWSIGGGPG